MHQLGAIGRRRVARALARQRRVEQAAARPVGFEQRVVHRRRVGPRLVELDPDRRSAADVAQRRQAVVGPGRQLAGAVAVAVVAAGHDVHGADVAVPRHPDVPLHVAVEREQLALEIEGVVVGVAEGAGDDREALRHGIDAVHGAVRADLGARAEAPPVLDDRQELRLAAAGERRRRIDLRLVDEERVVAGHHRQRAVRAAAQRMHAVLLDGVDERRDQRRALGDAVGVGVRHLVEAGLLGWRRLSLRHRRVARPVQRRPVVPEALAVPDAGADDDFALEDAVAVGVDQPPRVVQLLRHHQAALAVEGHGDVGVGLPRRHDALDGEVRQRREAPGFGAGGERRRRRTPVLRRGLRGDPDDGQHRQGQDTLGPTSHAHPHPPALPAAARAVRTSGAPRAAPDAPAAPTGFVRTSDDRRSCPAGSGSAATAR